MKLLEILVLANMILSRSLVIRFYTCVFSFVFSSSFFWLRERICLGRKVSRVLDQLQIDVCLCKNLQLGLIEHRLILVNNFFCWNSTIVTKVGLFFCLFCWKFFLYRVYRTMLLEFLNWYSWVYKYCILWEYSYSNLINFYNMYI